MSHKKEGSVPTEKKRNIAIATTVAGVLLLVFLLIVLIIQFVQIGVRNNRKRELNRLIEQGQQEYDGEVADLNMYLNTKDALFWEAFYNGYK